MDGWSGHLLIAPAWMSDPNFSQSVVLLIEHDERGAFGLVLNRPTESKVADVWREATGKPCETGATLHLGGPVAGPLIALHDREEHGDRQVLDGLWATTVPENLAALLAAPPRHLRLFAGYAGWGQGQLDRELQDAAWAVTPARAQDAFEPPGAALWHAALRRATQSLADPLAPPREPPSAARTDLN